MKELSFHKVKMISESARRNHFNLWLNVCNIPKLWRHQPQLLSTIWIGLHLNLYMNSHRYNYYKFIGIDTHANNWLISVEGCDEVAEKSNCVPRSRGISASSLWISHLSTSSHRIILLMIAYNKQNTFSQHQIHGWIYFYFKSHPR